MQILWYQNTNFYISTLPSGCCTTRELFGRVNPTTNKWQYAIVQTKDGIKSLIVLFEEGQLCL